MLLKIRTILTFIFAMQVSFKMHLHLTQKDRQLWTRDPHLLHFLKSFVLQYSHKFKLLGFTCEHLGHSKPLLSLSKISTSSPKALSYFDAAITLSRQLRASQDLSVGESNFERALIDLDTNFLLSESN